MDNSVVLATSDTQDNPLVVATFDTQDNPVVLVTSDTQDNLVILATSDTQDTGRRKTKQNKKQQHRKLQRLASRTPPTQGGEGNPGARKG
jgi:isocitrate lyase